MRFYVRIIIIVSLYQIFACWAWAQHANGKNYSKTTEDLVARIESNCYINFDSVYILCNELINLAKANDDILRQLYAISNICWNAERANKQDILKSYLKTGEELMLNHHAEIAKSDTAGDYRSMVMNALGTYQYNRGNYDAAIEKLSEIVNLGGKPLTRDSSMLRSSCYFIGHALFLLGNLDQAIQYFELGTRYIMKSEADYDYLWAMYYMYYTQYLLSINEGEKAREFILKSINILSRDPRKEYVRNPLKSNYQLMKDYYLKKNNLDSAVIFMKKALGLFRKNDVDYIIGYQKYGDLYYENKNLDSALYYYAMSLKLAETMEGYQHHRSSALASMAKVFYLKKEFHKARDLYNKSLAPLFRTDPGKTIRLESIPRILLPVETMKILTDKAQLYYSWALHDSIPEYLDSSIILLENALFLNDLSRRELVNFVTKEARTESRSDITALGLKTSVKAYNLTGKRIYLQKIFAFIEESKGNIIMDKFDETRARRHAGIPDSLQEALFVLQKEIAAISDSIIKVESHDEMSDRLRHQYNDRFLAYNNQISVIEKNYPKYYQLKYDPQNVNLWQIQSLLPVQTLMIQYSMDNDKIYTAGITRKKVFISVTEKDENLMKNLKLLLRQLSDPDISEKSLDKSVYNEFIESSSLVYERILKPILDEVNPVINELIIIPEGELCYLPFEVLITDNTIREDIDYESLSYLIKEYRIRYDYSASLWKENNSSKKDLWKSYFGYAPEHDVSAGRLYASSNEVNACSRIWNGYSFTGENATENSFKNTSFAGSIIQLATHTRLNDLEPQKSCFAFARGKDSLDDGLLYTYELYNMNIPAQLAILSGCETGIGNIRKGEGIISLARAFKYAGCPNIIMSLWKVNDRTTSEIMISFNRNLKKGMPKDIALQKAKLSYLKKNVHLHPAYWGSFVLIGNNKPVNRDFFNYYMIILFLFLATFLIYFKRYKTTRMFRVK